MSGLYDACNAAGGMTAFEWERDPKRLLFILARYKFVAKLLRGKRRVLEVGCADGFASRLLLQYVDRLDAVDIDREAIEAALERRSGKWPVNYFVGDILAAPFAESPYDACFALDLLEHFHAGEEEDAFLTSMRSCAPVCVIGSPSLESQPWASELSRKGHVNCKTEAELRRAMNRFWPHVFIFGMNDETLHTGFEHMAHYRFALAVA